MASDLARQKKQFCDLEQGLRNSKTVLDIVYFYYVSAHEKQIVKEFCIRAAGSSEVLNKK